MSYQTMTPQDFQNLIGKYSNKEVFPRMFGTEGKMNYIILAKRPEVNLQLGIRPLLTIGKSKTSVGFRLRSAPIPAGDVVPLLGNGQSVQQGFPSTGWAYPWEKVSSERASLVRMFSFERPAEQIKFIWEDLSVHRFFGKLNSFLLECAPPEQWQITPEELKEWMLAGFYPTVAQIQAQFDPKFQLEMIKTQSQKQAEEAALKIADLENAIDQAAGSGVGEDEYVPGKLDTEEFIDPKSTAAVMLGKVKPVLAHAADAADITQMNPDDYVKPELNIVSGNDMDDMDDDEILAEEGSGDE